GPAPTPPPGPGGRGAAVAAGAAAFLIGAPRDGGAAPDTGIVYEVSASSATFGRLLRVLRKPGTPAAGDAFGAAVTAVGQSVLVGPPGARPPPPASPPPSPLQPTAP